MNEPSLCLRALGPDLEQPFWELDFLRLRFDCLTRAGHPLQGAAEEDLVRYLEATGGDVRFGVEP